MMNFFSWGFLYCEDDDIFKFSVKKYNIIDKEEKYILLTK
jgi:hypothetical protein